MWARQNDGRASVPYERSRASRISTRLLMLLILKAPIFQSRPTQAGRRRSGRTRARSIPRPGRFACGLRATARHVHRASGCGGSCALRVCRRAGPPLRGGKVVAPRKYGFQLFFSQDFLMILGARLGRRSELLRTNCSAILLRNPKTSFRVCCKMLVGAGVSGHG